DKIYFPTEPGVAVPAWRILIWQPVNAYYVIVDAANGTMLWRKNIVEDQSQSATYQVYTNPNAMINGADSPAPLTPGPTSPDGTLTTQAQRGAVIQMFYLMNLYHDELYRLGFTEAAHNFQNDNFGRGGVGSDRVSAEGQDSLGFNNANFGTAADGQRGRMQMY